MLTLSYQIFSHFIAHFTRCRVRTFAVLHYIRVCPSACS